MSYAVRLAPFKTLGTCCMECDETAVALKVRKSRAGVGSSMNCLTYPGVGDDRLHERVDLRLGCSTQSSLSNWNGTGVIAPTGGCPVRALLCTLAHRRADVLRIG